MNKSFVLISFVLALFVLSVTTPNLKAQEKETKLIELKSEKGASGEDINIKSKDSDNDPTSRGNGPGACYVKFQNYTNWRVWVYVDGSCEGLLSAYSEGGLYTGTGSTLLYAVAIFKDGSKMKWGPYSVDCNYKYTLKLSE